MNLVITRCENPCLYGDSHSVCYADISSSFPRTKSNYLIWNVFNLEFSRKYRRGKCLIWRFCSGLLSSSYNLPFCMIFIPFQVFLVSYYLHYSRGEEVVKRTQLEIFVSFLGAFAKFRKGRLASSYLYLISSARPHGTSRLPLDEFSWNLILEYFSKICQEIQALLKYNKKSGYITWRPTYF
jgi:hypothetical protein